MSEREPSQAEVDQVEPEAFAEDLRTVTVKVSGPVRSQLMPAQIWSVRNYELTATQATKIANRDPKRQQLKVSNQGIIWIAPVEMGAKQNVGFRIPILSAPNDFFHTEEVWAISDSGTTSVSVSEAYWTE